MATQKEKDPQSFPAPKREIKRETELNDFLNHIFPDKEECFKNKTCVNCKKDASTFSTEKGAKEYSITVLCEQCQHQIWCAKNDWDPKENAPKGYQGPGISMEGLPAGWFD